VISGATEGRSRRWLGLVLAVLLGLGATACGRSSDEESGAQDDDEEAPADDGGGDGGGGSGLDAGEFGDLGVVCQDGDAAGATDTGVTDDEIKIGTITNKGADVRPGLNQEMFDSAAAFVDWCNEHGGINGRELVLEDLDAKLSDYGQRIAEACEDTFALVGGGAIFDNNDEGARVECGLANMPGFVVTPEARVGDLQVQPLPNPVYTFAVQSYRTMQRLHPGATKYGILYVDLEGVKTVYQQVKESVEKVGFEVVYEDTYAAINETGWSGFIQSMKEEGVQGFELVGEPENMTALLNAMQTENWYPEFIVMQPNMYDQKFEDEAKAAAGPAVYSRIVFPMFDMDGEDYPGMADYQALMEQYRPDGKYPALLGAQALSGMLLFAQAAGECGSDLTRQCLLDNAAAQDDWTAGGLHSPTDPGNSQAPECGIIVKFTPDGYVYDEEATDPNEGIFNCSPDNVVELTGDYGVERPDE
jgi:ABC-type branched-subunit amino acid transport system substrate-binding protein